MSLEKMFEKVLGTKPPKKSAKAKGKAVKRQKAKKPIVKKEKTSTDKLFDSSTRILKKFTHAKYGRLRERDIEQQVVQALRFGLPAGYRDKVEYEKEFGRGKRLDISIADEVGIEIKLSPTSSDLDRLDGQIRRYMDGGIFKRIAVLVVAGDASRPEMLTERKRLIEAKKRGKVRVIIR